MSILNVKNSHRLIRMQHYKFPIKDSKKIKCSKSRKEKTFLYSDLIDNQIIGFVEIKIVTNFSLSYLIFEKYDTNAPSKSYTRNINNALIRRKKPSSKIFSKVNKQTTKYLVLAFPLHEWLDSPDRTKLFSKYYNDFYKEYILNYYRN